MATITKGLIQREDFAAFDGTTLAATRTDSTGGTQTGTRVGNTLDVKRVYGSATSGALQKAVNLLGSTNVGIEFTPETWAITESVTVPSNLTCVVPAGCVFDVSAGKTLTIAGVLFRHHGTYTSGSGTVTVSGTDILASASQTGTDIYAADTGVADAYVILTGASISSYAAGQTFRFKALNANTGASTINVDGQGTKSIKLFGTSSALPANAILAGGVYTITYDGTNFQLQQQPVTSFIEGLLDDATAAAARATLGTNAPVDSTILVTSNTDTTGGSANTWKLLTMDNEITDTASVFASSKWTPGVIGSYLVFGSATITGSGGGNLTDGAAAGVRVTRFNAAGTAQNVIQSNGRQGAAALASHSAAGILRIVAADDYFGLEGISSDASWEADAGAGPWFGGWRIS